ncbi:MAG: pyrroloquinoline-quinone synthase PqqC [Cyanobacteria bacterium P01_A01_bin.80]
MQLLNPEIKKPWTKQEFESVLYSQKSRYHDLHPFHQRMNQGLLTQTEIRNWVANRFYYQKNIPLKDAAILANCPDREVRREWIERIVDHDGRSGDEGGIEAWIQLGKSVGLSRSELLDERHVLPGVRYAVDAYVNFCRNQLWIIAIAASLTELFGPGAIQVRLAALEKHYDWIDSVGFEYFRVRLKKAPRDAKYALNLVLQHCITRDSQEQAVQALAFKCDLLWTQLDAIEKGDTRPSVIGNW